MHSSNTIENHFFLVQLPLNSTNSVLERKVRFCFTRAKICLKQKNEKPFSLIVKEGEMLGIPLEVSYVDYCKMYQHSSSTGTQANISPPSNHFFIFCVITLCKESLYDILEFHHNAE